MVVNIPVWLSDSIYKKKINVRNIYKDHKK